MADTKISALTAGDPAVGTDKLAAARAGASVYITAASIAALASGGGGSSPNFADNETPTTWSTNTEYVLAHTPNPTASLQVFVEDSALGGVNGMNKLLVLGVDYTMSGTHILITPAMTINKIKAWYRY
jgi:hypothetical protein